MARIQADEAVGTIFFVEDRDQVGGNLDEHHREGRDIGAGGAQRLAAVLARLLGLGLGVGGELLLAFGREGDRAAVDRLQLRIIGRQLPDPGQIMAGRQFRPVVQAIFRACRDIGHGLGGRSLGALGRLAGRRRGRAGQGQAENGHATQQPQRADPEGRVAIRHHSLPLRLLLRAAG